MNTAIFFLRNNAPTDEILLEFCPSLVLNSNHKRLDYRLAAAGIQLDENIMLENNPIDLVCVINENNLRLDNIKVATKDDYLERFFYVQKNIHTSSFYCKPSAFSTISNLYKLNFENYNFQQTNVDTVELLTEKIYFLINRLGFEVKIG